MKKIIYVTKSIVAPSESFIYDLIEAFEHSPEYQLSLAGLADTAGLVNGKEISPLGGWIQPKASKARLFAQKFAIFSVFRKKLFAFQCRSYRQRFESLAQEINPDVAYIDYGTIGIFVYRELVSLGIPYVVHVHGYDASQKLEGVADQDYPPEFVRMVRHARKVIAPSDHLRRRMILAGCDRDKVAVHPYSPNFSMISESNEKFEHPTVMMLGRLTAKKNPVAVLYAFRRVISKIPEARLELVGDGPLKTVVEEIIKSLGLQDNVRLHGVLKREEAFQLLSKSHVFVQHSVTSSLGDQEGFPVSLAEAAAHGLPIVSTIHSGIPENVVDGETGYLVQEHDFEKMGDRIIELLSNPDLANQLGKNGKDRISTICDPTSRWDLISSALAGQ